jgi:hypothetical protein
LLNVVNVVHVVHGVHIVNNVWVRTVLDGEISFHDDILIHINDLGMQAAQELCADAVGTPEPRD